MRVEPGPPLPLRLQLCGARQPAHVRAFLGLVLHGLHVLRADVALRAVRSILSLSHQPG